MSEQPEGIVVLEPSDKPKAKLEEKIAQNNFANDCSALLSTEGGRRYMWQLLADCGLMEDPFVAGAQDITNYKLGAQRIGRKIFADLLSHVPSLYNQMAAENSGQNQKGKTK